VQVWLPWKAQGKAKWGKPKELNKKRSTEDDLEKGRPRYLIVDLDADEVEQRKQLKDLELEIKNWIIVDKKKKDPPKESFLNTSAKYLEVDGLEFGLIDDVGNQLQIKMKQKGGEYDGFEDPEGYVDVWEPEEIHYRVICSPYEQTQPLRTSALSPEELKAPYSGDKRTPATPNKIDSRVSHPKVKDSAEKSGVTLVSMRLHSNDEPQSRVLKAVGKMSSAESNKNRNSPAKRVKDFEQRAAQSIQYYFLYHLRKEQLRKMAFKLSSARSILVSKNLSWRGFLRYWAASNPFEKNHSFEDTLRRFILSTSKD
jgi:hypothetical protein